MCCIYPSFKLYQQSLPLPRIASPHYPCSLRKDLPLERLEQILLVLSLHCRRPHHHLQGSGMWICPLLISSLEINITLNPKPYNSPIEINVHKPGAHYALMLRH